MPRPLSDDLRCRILDAYERKEGSQRQLARRFGVTFEYVRKIRRQLRPTGKKERAAQSRHGPKSHITDAVKEQLRGWLRAQPYRTLGMGNAPYRERKEGWCHDADRIGNFLFIEALRPPVGGPGLKLNCHFH